MSARIAWRVEGPIAWVCPSHPGRMGAMTRHMWRELREVFVDLQNRRDCRCVIVHGEQGAFCAGGDISEYPAFRFDPESLRVFHEDDVWGGLQAMLNCDIPMIAVIDGPCMGAGLELASCCDIRLASDRSKFGAPIARLGFPMAPREAALVAGAVGALTAREMLLEAAVLDAAEMHRRGFLNALRSPPDLMTAASERAARIVALAPQAARLNKILLRNPQAPAWDYAPSAEHREGVMAFLEKRTPQF